MAKAFSYACGSHWVTLPGDTGHVQRHVWVSALGCRALLLASDRRPCPADYSAQGSPTTKSPSPRHQWSQGREALSERAESNEDSNWQSRMWEIPRDQ